MKRSLSILTMLMVAVISLQAQGYMATKTRLDSLTIYKFHGSASIGCKVEQTDKFKFELDAEAECMVPFKKHKVRLAGNASFNMINREDNGNRGFAYLAGDFYQFNIKEDTRYKNPVFFTIMGGVQYDFCRNLQTRLFAGMFATFQPLRNHPHLCLEPSVGLIADFNYWNMLGGSDRTPLRNMYNNDSGEVAKMYLGISPDGYIWQRDPSVAVAVNFMGEWNVISFNLYCLVSQPVTKPFKYNKDMEDLLPEQLKDMCNTKMLPMVTTDFTVQVQIWKMLSFKIKSEFLWDGGQLPNDYKKVTVGDKEVPRGARNMRYCVTGGFVINW